jgi:hypothetical protein
MSGSVPLFYWRASLERLMEGNRAFVVHFVDQINRTPSNPETSLETQDSKWGNMSENAKEVVAKLLSKEVANQSKYKVR